MPGVGGQTASLAEEQKLRVENISGVPRQNQQEKA
jgi:hypothetical protein